MKPEEVDDADTGGSVPRMKGDEDIFLFGGEEVPTVPLQKKKKTVVATAYAAQW